MRAILKKNRLNTVCREARCPNIWECYARRTATFLILGNICTRNCRFCAVRHGIPGAVDRGEPRRLAETVAEVELDYVVITSVTRDDLSDGGAGVFADTIEAIRQCCPGVCIEVLIPDFQGSEEALRRVVDAAPQVINHNIETVSRLYEAVRPRADYHRSLKLLESTKKMDASMVTKSGMMVGLGEGDEEIRRTFEDLTAAGCDVLTVGQYLQPAGSCLPVERFVHPTEFDDLRRHAEGLGFPAVAGGPFVRSSYRARELYEQAKGTTGSTGK